MSAGFGKETSETGLGQQTRTGNELTRLIQELFGETKGLRNTLIEQMTELLQEGGIGAQIPIINRAVDASARATGGALRDLDSDLSSQGLTGTPFGEAMKAQLGSEGKFAQSQVPLGIWTEMVKAIPGFLSNLTNAGIGGYSAAAQAEAGNQPEESKGWNAQGGVGGS